MKKRFIFELIAGLICIACIFLIGPKGQASMVILILTPLFSKRKPDEREYHLFYKSGNLTMGMFIVFLTLISMLGINVGEAQLTFSVAAFLVLHGISGLYIFSTE